MKKYLHEVSVITGTAPQAFKVKVTTTGTATIQFQAADEGFDNYTDGAYSATATGVLNCGIGEVRVQLTGDAQFFMG